LLLPTVKAVEKSFVLKLAVISPLVVLLRSPGPLSVIVMLHVPTQIGLVSVMVNWKLALALEADINIPTAAIAAVDVIHFRFILHFLPNAAHIMGNRNAIPNR
jgi:hypothetical protein